MSISDIKKVKLSKLKNIEKAGINPYPITSKRTHTIEQSLNDFSKLSRSKKELTLVGRIRSIRAHGGSTFLDFEDGTGRMQAFFNKNLLGEKSYKFFSESFDIGDFIEIRGILFKTKKKEKTIQVSDFKMLSKSLLPLPEKWHGLKDVEERYRKRYLDLIFDSEIKNKLEMRSKIIKEIRSFLDKESFLEVETPILQPIYGGASAKPFKTHLNALDMDLYLRISPELYLKRLQVAGFEKIYEIGRCFRNEGMDKTHNPDFTMLEFYWAYTDYKELMKFTEKMLKTIILNIFGKLKIKYKNKDIDFKSPWQRIEFNQLLKKYTKINLDEINIQGLKKKAKELDVKVEKNEGKREIADRIYKKYCLPKIWNPTFIIHHPLGTFPLAKALEKTPEKLANFQLVVGNIEMVNAFSELNNPLEQRKRFKEQEKLYKKGLDESQRMDEDFLEALEYGMPLTAGFGMGIDRLVTFLNDFNSLRESILFPTMKPKNI